MVPPLTRISLYPEHVTGKCPVILLGTLFYTFHDSDRNGHADLPQTNAPDIQWLAEKRLLCIPGN